MNKLFCAALAVAAAFSAAATASADTFETSAAQAFSDSGIVTQSRQSGAKFSADSAVMGMILMERGGDHGGACCRDHGHGGDHDRGRDRDHDRDHRRDHDRDHDHDRDRVRPLPPLNPTPGHWNPAPSAPQPPRAGWGRWGGHPGWGYGHDWRWHDDYPTWWGWTPFVAVPGASRYQCLSYYRDLDGTCQGYCTDDNNACLQNCSQYAPGAVDCDTACGTSFNYCRYQCDADRDARSATCP